MEDYVKRPLYEDFKKHAWQQLRDDRPVLSRERLYRYADRTLILSIYFVMYAMFFLMVFFLPKPGITVYAIIMYSVYAVITTLCLTFYQCRFVYRFARFNVLWEDWQRPGAACEGCDEQGDFLPTKENRSAAFKSRFAFFALLFIVAAVVALFYYFTWGMAEQRVKSSPLLAEFARIAEKQGDVSIDVDSRDVLVWSLDGESYIGITPNDGEELKRIFEELQWNYVERLYWKGGTVHVFMHGWFQSKSFDVYLRQ